VTANEVNFQSPGGSAETGFWVLAWHARHATSVATVYPSPLYFRSFSSIRWAVAFGFAFLPLTVRSVSRLL
jgi:hypothetical protein